MNLKPTHLPTSSEKKIKNNSTGCQDILENLMRGYLDRFTFLLNFTVINTFKGHKVEVNVLKPVQVDRSVITGEQRILSRGRGRRK